MVRQLNDHCSIRLVKYSSFSYVRLWKLVPRSSLLFPFKHPMWSGRCIFSRQTWSKRPPPVLRPPSQFGVQVTFGVFNLERSRVLHWRGQSLYRQTQQSGKEHTAGDCLQMVAGGQKRSLWKPQEQRTYAAVAAAAGVEPGGRLPSEDGHAAADRVAVVRLCQNSPGESWFTKPMRAVSDVWRVAHLPGNEPWRRTWGCSSPFSPSCCRWALPLVPLVQEDIGPVLGEKQTPGETTHSHSVHKQKKKKKDICVKKCPKK